jgi:hypothetical protein
MDDSFGHGAATCVTTRKLHSTKGQDVTNTGSIIIKKNSLIILKQLF